MSYNRVGRERSALFLWVGDKVLRKSDIKAEIKKFLKKTEKRLKRFILAPCKANCGRVPTTELVNIVFNFCELYSGRTFYPYQEQFSKRIIRSVLENDGEELTALFARQSGKTETNATTVGGMMIILPQLANMPMFADDKRLQMFKDGLWVGIFAPSLRQAQTAYGRLKSRLQCKNAMAILEDPEFRLEFSTSNGQTVALTNGSFATAISASDGANIEGESFKLIICEEAQDISNFKVRKSIHPMGAAYNATIVKIGTATTFKGDFYEAIHRNKANQESRKSHIKNHFEYDWNIAAKYNPNYAKYVEKEKKRLGEKSDEFRMSYCLEWIIERGMFIDITKFEQDNTEPLLERSFYDKSANHVAGIDLGGKGDDTIITVVEVNWDMPVSVDSFINENGEEETYTTFNTYLKDWCCISNEPDYEEQYPLIVDYLNHFLLARVVCDATREASISHRLRANLKCEVIPFIFTTKSKSEVYKHLDKEIVSGRARICAGPNTVETREYKDFIQQLGELQKGWSGTHMVVSHLTDKDHDDYPDSWALAVWGTSFKGEVNNTETVTNKFTAKSNSQIKGVRTRNRITAKRR
jgi:hypothetical protein|nr:MAG TPA: Terminase [Caudoviricetes sp.]